MDVVHAPQQFVDAAGARWADTRGRLDRLADWRRRLARELSELPDTMQRLRHGAANFERAGERLAKSSASLEEIADLYQATVAESGRRSARALDALRNEVDSLAKGAGSPEQISARVADLQRAYDAIADLNPFWPRPTSKR